MRGIFIVECERRKRSQSRHPRRGGFSLVELLVVTVLVASSAMAAAPRFARWHARDRVDGVSSALLASLTLARGESIARGLRVVVCPAEDGGRCSSKGRTHADGPRDWSGGWAVVVEAGLTGQPLRIYRRVSGVSIAAAPASVAFTPPAGQVIGGFRKFELVATGFAASGQGEALRRCIRIAAGGRARLERGGCDGRARA